MKKIIFISLLTCTSYVSMAQFPDVEERKKMRIKKISTVNTNVAKTFLVDKNGEITQELTEGIPIFIKEFFYNSNQKPDSIISEWGRSDRQYDQYFSYFSDGSNLSLMVFTDRTDSIFTSGDNKKIREHSTDGSKVKYDYNTKHQLIKKIYIDKDKKMETEIFLYDLQGRIIKTVFTSVSGTVFTEVYTYNPKGKWLTKKSTSIGGYPEKSNSKYEYNPNGLLVKEMILMGKLDDSESWKDFESITYEFY